MADLTVGGLRSERWGTPLIEQYGRSTLGWAGSYEPWNEENWPRAAL
jgi:hypothetical protein